MEKMLIPGCGSYRGFQEDREWKGEAGFLYVAAEV